MNNERQNPQPEQRSIYDPQLRLAFAPMVKGEAQDESEQRVEWFVSPRGNQSPTSPLTVMQEVLEPENLKAALAKVQANKGAPGIDGMTVKQLPDHLKTHWPHIIRQLCEGTYKPLPVKRVEIGWRYPNQTAGCASLASRRFWTVSSSRRCSRF